MTALMSIQFISIFLAYAGITVFLPAVVFRKRLCGMRIMRKFMICYTIGNFYVINLVFALQLLKISHPVTLWIGTAVPAFAAWSKINQVPVRSMIRNFFQKTRRVSEGKLGIKTVCHRAMYRIFGWLRGLYAMLYRLVISKSVEWLLFGILMAGLFWIYGRRLILAYGYAASDIPVHMSWINQMSRGNLFCSGVYPFGFHCVMYYLHTVFGFDTYMLLCQFFFVQVIFAHVVLLAFLKLLCRTKYLPYAGTFVYAFGSFWAKNTYSRYAASLPQEFGMIFVFPAVYFAIAFFQTDKDKIRKKKARSDWNLVCFAFSFSLTLAIHFYGTMIAGLCCIGIACGFFVRFVQKEYFVRIMITGIVSVVLAVLPMGIAFATGTPLQGSLGWGLSVIQGDSGKSENTEQMETESSEIVSETEEAEQTGEPGSEETENGKTAESSETKEMSGTEISSVQEESGEIQQEAVPQVSMKERLGRAKESVAAQINSFIFQNVPEQTGAFCLYAMAALTLLGLCHFVFPGRRTYGMALISMGVAAGCIALLLDAGSLGIPRLMDPARCSIYFAYIGICVPVLLVDGIVYAVLGFRWMRILRSLLSLVLTGAMLAGMLGNGLYKQPDGFASDFVTNGAVTSLTNIIHENPDLTWTIVSANDETQMGLDHGYHTETISFLRQMEYLSADTNMTIPTQTVYFFIEKIPVNYSLAYAKSGQSISVDGALEPLPNVGGIGMYEGERRWVVMSRMYYWAQAFEQLYPDAMSVYYESDNFICYKLTQNPYHLYNLAIDYGFNQLVDEEEES